MKLVCDSDSENKDVIKILMKKYGICQIVILPYNLQVNEMIEVRHRSITDALSKMMMREIITRADS